MMMKYTGWKWLGQAAETDTETDKGIFQWQNVTKFLSPQKLNVVDTFKNFDGSEEEKNAMLGYITRAKMTAKAFSSLWGYFIVSWNEAVGMQPFKALTNTVWGSGEQKKAEKEKNSIDVVKDGTETIAIVFPSQDLVWYT